MKFNTQLYYNEGDCDVFGVAHRVSWGLCFVEDGFIEDWERIISCSSLLVKPTKRQVRKLRREFRKKWG